MESKELKLGSEKLMYYSTESVDVIIGKAGDAMDFLQVKNWPSKIRIRSYGKEGSILGASPVSVSATNPFYSGGFKEENESKGLIDELWKTKRRKEELERQTDAMLSYISRNTEATRELSKALAIQKEGRLCMFEKYDGVIVRMLDDEVVIRFETGEGKVEKVYDRSQFIGRDKISEGARVEIQCFGWVRAHVSQGIERFLKPGDMKRFKEAAQKRQTGPSEI